jgi:hypothetical protein
MEAPDLQGAIAFISNFINLYMLFAAIAIIYLTFVAIFEVGFKKTKLNKVFARYFIKIFALWAIASCLIVIVAGQMMTSLWDGILLLIDLVFGEIQEALKGAF